MRVRDHDFTDEDLGRSSPTGSTTSPRTAGSCRSGTSRDTAAFAVNALRLWWQDEGSLPLPGREAAAGHLRRRRVERLRAAGCGRTSSPSWRRRPGCGSRSATSRPARRKWNKIEHRLFCHITRTWRARPLMTAEDAVAGIAATVTGQGLKCTAVLDDGDYPDGQRGQRRADEVPRGPRPGPRRLPRRVELRRPARPPPRPGTGAGTGAPRPLSPQAVLNHPALTGLDPGDLHALAAALEVPFGARREQRNYPAAERRPRQPRPERRRLHGKRRLDPHRPRARPPPPRAPAPARAEPSAPCSASTSHRQPRHRPDRRTPGRRQPHPARRCPRPRHPPHPRRAARLRPPTGITLTIPENGYPMPEQFKTRTNRTTRDTPETAN